MSDGIWEGEDADSAVAANGRPGTFGVFCGNWGENFTCKMAQEHMEFDAKKRSMQFRDAVGSFAGVTRSPQGRTTKGQDCWGQN